MMICILEMLGQDQGLENTVEVCVIEDTRQVWSLRQKECATMVTIHQITIIINFNPTIRHLTGKN